MQKFRLAGELKNRAGAFFRVQSGVRSDALRRYRPRAHALARSLNTAAGRGWFKDQDLRGLARFAFDQRPTRRAPDLLVASQEKGHRAPGRKTSGGQAAQRFDGHHTRSFHVEDSWPVETVAVGPKYACG